MYIKRKWETENKNNKNGEKVEKPTLCGILYGNGARHIYLDN